MRRILWTTGTLALGRISAASLVSRFTPERSKRFHDRVRASGQPSVEDDDEREGSYQESSPGCQTARPRHSLEGTGWSKTFDGVRRRHLELSTATGALSWYPGGGGASCARCQRRHRNVNQNAGLDPEDESGLGLVGALGYEWRLTKKFAMGPHGEYVWMDLGDDVGTADNFGGGLDFDWYW
jgi:hypothetical protein